MSEDKITKHWTVWALPILWKRRRQLLCVVITGIVLSILVALLIPPKFASSTRLMPADPQSKAGYAMLASAMGGMPIASQAGGLSSLVNSRSSNSVFLAVLGSRTVQNDLINRFDLRKIYHVRCYEDARKKLTSRTTIDEDRKTGVLTITVIDRDAGRARDLAMAYVDELNHLVVVMDSSSAHRERVFLEERLKKVRQDMDEAGAELSQFSSRNATVDPTSQSKVMLDATAKLQGEVIAARGELRGLQTTYADDNVRVLQARARVESLQRELAKLGGKQGESGGDLDEGQLYPSLRKLPLLDLKYMDLYRRERIQDSLFEILTKQYELARVEEAREVAAVKVLDPAEVPERKSSPPRTVIAVSGAAFAIILGVIWIIGPEAWRRSAMSKHVRAVLAEALFAERHAEPDLPNGGLRDS